MKQTKVVLSASVQTISINNYEIRDGVLILWVDRGVLAFGIGAWSKLEVTQ